MADKKKFTLQINYKSGIIMTVECDDWELKQGFHGLESMTIHGPIPYSPCLNIGEIESVWQVRP